MELSFAEYQPADAEMLIHWLTSDTWPYDPEPQLDPERVRRSLEAGKYSASDQKTFWIQLESGERVGLLRFNRFEEIGQEVLEIGIRICTPYRGKGIGVQAVTWFSDYIFRTVLEIQRIEGFTRADNWPMRRTFRRCGYAKEAHFRKGWFDGQHDKIGYALLREDWERGELTPVPWNDEL